MELLISSFVFSFTFIHRYTQIKDNAAVAKAVDKAWCHLCGCIQAITQCQQAQHIFISVAAVLSSLATSCYCPAD